MIDIQIDQKQVSRFLKNIFPILEEAAMVDKISPYELYFALMEVIYINRNSAKLSGIDDQVLLALEMTAHKYVDDKIKNYGSHFWN